MAKECEDTAHKTREKERGDWKREQSQSEDRLACGEEEEELKRRKERVKMSAGREVKRVESKEVMGWL